MILTPLYWWSKWSKPSGFPAGPYIYRHFLAKYTASHPQRLNTYYHDNFNAISLNMFIYLWMQCSVRQRNLMLTPLCWCKTHQVIRFFCWTLLMMKVLWKDSIVLKRHHTLTVACLCSCLHFSILRNKVMKAVVLKHEKRELWDMGCRNVTYNMYSAHAFQITVNNKM
jgi:hypothetical protein